MIHGLPSSGYDKSLHNKKNDWTEGCVAIKNDEMDFYGKG